VHYDALTGILDSLGEYTTATPSVRPALRCGAYCLRSTRGDASATLEALCEGVARSPRRPERPLSRAYWYLLKFAYEIGMFY